MSNEEFMQLIDEEIAELDDMWDIYYDKNDRERCKMASAKKLAFEMFRRKVLRKMGGSVI